VNRRALKENMRVREKYVLMKLEVKIDISMCMKAIEM